MATERVFKAVNLAGFLSLIAVFVATNSVPAAWRVIGALCIVDGLFIARTGSTRVLGHAQKPIEGTVAYVIAGAAVVGGILLLAFSNVIYCHLDGSSDACS